MPDKKKKRLFIPFFAFKEPGTSIACKIVKRKHQQGKYDAIVCLSDEIGMFLINETVVLKDRLDFIAVQYAKYCNDERPVTSNGLELVITYTGKRESDSETYKSFAVTPTDYSFANYLMNA